MKFLIFASVLFLTVSVYGDWAAGPWKECSAVCDGVQVRKVFCKNPVTGEVAPDSLCNATPKPATSQPCSPPCTYEWLAGEWGECSEICGPGFQSRGVQCILVETSATVIDSYCDSASMPALTQPCNDGLCGDEDTIDEDTADGDLIDEDLFEGEADEDFTDIDEIFVDEDTADNETVNDETEVTDEYQTADNSNTDDFANEDEGFNENEPNNDDVQIVDNSNSDDDSANEDENMTENDPEDSNDSGCGCVLIGL